MKHYLKKINLLILCTTFINCQSNDDTDLTTLNLATIESSSTANNASITYTTLIINGNITSNGGSPILNRGVCWSKNQNPTIENEKVLENTDEFSSTIENLTVNTTYYFRVFATNSVGTSYGEEQSYTTLNLDDTSWIFNTYYTQIGDFLIVSKINFYADNTTRFDELDIAGQCSGCFITFGTWSLNENELTYIWEGNDLNNSTYVYKGTFSGMTINGTYTHQTTTDGVWTAVME